MSKEAIKLALEAFETLTQYNMVRANIFRRFEPTCTGDYVDLKEFREKAEPAITALREALAEQPAQKEFISPGGGYVPVIPVQQALDKMAENARDLGLDYEPAQRKPLTDEQITKGWWIPEEAPQSPRDGFVAGVRFAESAHNIKEQP